ncbi:hypothetical protein TorRG33x02_284310 [Trema orientale]|uniref:Uncharacterized protein n=1 Tax=Trema orientale TaxID=63057 RepID=A0A2P5CHU7_TREOI|nr:hypothetical protein TorRG33x02_284310 [Trema orientale]
MEGFLKTGLFGSLLSPKASPHGSPVRGIEAEPSLQIQWRRLISSSDPFVDKHHHPLFHLGFNKSLFFEWARPLDDTYAGFGFLLRLIGMA